MYMESVPTFGHKNCSWQCTWKLYLYLSAVFPDNPIWVFSPKIPRKQGFHHHISGCTSKFLCYCICFLYVGGTDSFSWNPLILAVVGTPISLHLIYVYMKIHWSPWHKASVKMIGRGNVNASAASEKSLGCCRCQKASCPLKWPWEHLFVFPN